MRKLIGLALISLLAVLGWGIVQVSIAQQSTPQDNAAVASEHMMSLHKDDAPVPSGAIAQAPTDGISAETVTYGTLDGTDITGYLARPADATEPLPGLIVIHEWWGLNENIEAMTRMLAAEGYAALAVDLYGNQVAETPETARSLVQSALENPELLRENLRQAHDYLDTTLNAPKVGSIGWCFGGTWSLNTALTLPEQLDATVIYYGGGITTDPDALSALEMPIQGHFGELDDNPPPETVQQFEAALNDVGKSPEIYTYEDADHAFANPSGDRYNPEAAELAWERTTKFLEEHLKG
ncbi:MAG: dienelactone hydrolase family protein [Elainellaceae cyanobacterium]